MTHAQVNTVGALSHSMDILALRDQVALLPKYNEALKAIESQIEQKTNLIDELRNNYEKGRKSVDRMIDGSFSGFLLNLIGQRDNKIDKLQQQEVNAKLEYDSAKISLESLMTEKDATMQKISALEADKNAFEAELDARRVKMNNDPAYTAILQERDRLLNQADSAQKALAVVHEALVTVLAILDVLQSAAALARHNMRNKGGGFITRGIKMSHIDTAERIFCLLKSQLEQFNEHIAHLEGFRNLELKTVSKDHPEICLILNNVFWAASVHGEIEENTTIIQNMQRELETAATNLKTAAKNTKEKLVQSNYSEEEFLVSL